MRVLAAGRSCQKTWPLGPELGRLPAGSRIVRRLPRAPPDGVAEAGFC